MTKETNCCSRCGRNLQLIDDFPPEYAPVSLKKGLELCPECYRNLSQEELGQYFR